MKKLFTLALIGVFSTFLTSCSNTGTADLYPEGVNQTRQNEMKSSAKQDNDSLKFSLYENKTLFNESEVLERASESETKEVLQILNQSKESKSGGGIMCSAGLNTSNGWAVTMSISETQGVTYWFVRWNNGVSTVEKLRPYMIGTCNRLYISWYLGV